ncbi:Putative glucose-6-phosphate 1-dehydrogenase, partial [Candidatus Arthromitus sp. SFB-3]
DKEYRSLKDLIKSMCVKHGYNENILYYMAVSPEYFSIIVDRLRLNDLADSTRGIKRVIIEKPFGENLTSARELNEKMTKTFTEKEIYRIDHYLGKEMSQNIMAIRFANPILEFIWNNRYIDNIQITSNESLGVLTRGKYYEKSGALKDMFQNHMLQLLTLIAMEPPVSLNTEDIRDEKVKVLKAMPKIDEKFVRENIVRGQYIEDSKGTLKGYRSEQDVSKDSMIETFVAIKCFINNYRWTGVPFYIRTGKRLS